MRIKTLLISLLCMIGLYVHMNILAASQGRYGVTSSGNVRVSITIPPRVKVSGLSDIQLQAPATATTSVSDVTGKTTACIFNNDRRTYVITATGEHGQSNLFRARSAAGNYIHYTAYWHDNSNATVLAQGVPLTNQRNAVLNSKCPNGTNATLNVVFHGNDIQHAEPGVYEDRINLVLTN